ncbi:TetR/AcrR family transcriptional regulator [Geodermatophilus sp. YIM 151500]|uniref:TetR/AcrR family transcriptional regulator n=1 Tax=Geodermatophilus sp. YIM 151500 TaxID=2984531 RepID=UPI0021E3938F|nr:TetR/AcrR family transcriptional regulator [Geodermatophilus sp. YIM 151500]MCV2488806.1 TetR/AcrR family transcriptional regulator [Geodermatophilus sp. YIM 151500]
MTSRDPIADAAARLLAARPTASMAEVAAAAGVSRATLFRRYPSRSALVIELSRRAVEAYTAAVEEARLEEGPAADALARLLGGLTRLAPGYGLLALQPIDEAVEADLLALAAETDDRVRRMVHRGQESGDLRVDVPAEWVLSSVTWLVVAAADGVRLGRLAAGDVERLLTMTVLDGLRRRGASAGDAAG